jgi:hypothetical protein
MSHGDIGGWKPVTDALHTYERFVVEFRTKTGAGAQSDVSVIKWDANVAAGAGDALDHNGFIVLRILGAVDESDYTLLPGGGDGLVDCAPGGRMP